MDAVLPIMFAMAIETERLTRGRGKEFAIQETMIWSVHLFVSIHHISGMSEGGPTLSDNGLDYLGDLHADTAPIGMRNMAKKRAPTFVVAVAMALPTTATSIRHTMWMERSPVRADVQVTKMETRKVTNCHGGKALRSA